MVYQTEGTRNPGRRPLTVSRNVDYHEAARGPRIPAPLESPMPNSDDPSRPGQPRSVRSPLSSDSAIRFPEFFVLEASAGSGKTHALSLRYVQFLLSEKVRRLSSNGLANILAITFTHNAAREMKDRILDWLRKCHEGDDEALGHVGAVVSFPPERLRAAAGEAVDRILDHYSDFQVDTIDSFTSSVFKASTVDLGLSPDYEITLEPAELIAYAFSRYLRRITAGSREGRDFEPILDLITSNQKAEGRFAWDPAPQVRDTIAALDGKLAVRNKPLAVEDFARERAALEKKLAQAAGVIQSVSEQACLTRDMKGLCFRKILPAIETGDFAGLIEMSFKTAPVKCPDTAPASEKAAALKVERAWARLRSLTDQYRRVYARSYYHPYLAGYRSFRDTLELVKRQKGVVFIDDINKRLAGYLDQGIVPDVYFRLGERVYHFLIDEFQDTSPMQWRNLVPLIENSLAQNGSLFVVGDIKQAIYGFRDADYRIMKSLEDAARKAAEGADPGPLNPFPSVRPAKDELTTNYRCRREILDFVKGKFLLGSGGTDERDEPGSNKKKAKPAPGAPVPADPWKYAEYLRESELAEFRQEPVDRGDDKHPGHVEYVVLDRAAEEAGPAAQSGDEGPGPDACEIPAGPETNDDAPEPANDPPEKREVQERVADLHVRGFPYSDIAVLTYKNESVVEIASWLNDKNIPFIAFSCLDIRQRKVVAEVLRLLQFLDSPPDDLSFAAFLQGGVWNKKLRRDADLVRLPAAPAELAAEWDRFLFDCRLKGESPLYTAFRRRYPDLWDRYLERFFKIVGYYPLYDLVTLIFRMFDLFDLFPEEESSLTRLLEAIKDFEGEGRNDLREFLSLSADEAGDPTPWTIDVPPDVEAVKVMSIHKAKGLGFPAVILLLYGEGSHGRSFHFEEDEDSVRVLKISKGMADRDEELGALYADAEKRDKVGRLNALYVAMTRASAELHVIGVKGKRMSYPFDFLGTVPYLSPHFKAEFEPPKSRKEEGAAGTPPEPLPPGWRPPAPAKAPASRPPRAAVLRPKEWFELPVNTRQTLNRDNIRRGEIAHALLAEIEALGPDVRADLEAAQSRLVVEEAEVPVYEEVKAGLSTFLETSGLRSFFEPRPGRTIRTELEVCDRTGRLRRLDRVVIDPAEVFVIDYKTGRRPAGGPAGEGEGSDRKIFEDYLSIMRDVHPGSRVRGAFAFVDEGTIEEIP